jgi:D-glycero-alpha-D-manno-heptose 1-phosphate guanylyltransferase
MEAVILAGGLGTRLRDLVAEVPKPMAPVNGKPFLEYVLEWITGYGIDKIVISGGYKADSITDHFGKCFINTPLHYVVEKEPLGTGGAISNAITGMSGTEIIIINGDTWFPINIGEFLHFHRQSSAKISVALKKMTESDRYGTVVTNGNDIISFSEKKFFNEGLINGGIYIIERSFVLENSLGAKFSFEKDILEKFAGSGLLKGMVFNDQFIDIGIPEDYMKAGSVMNFDLL